MVNGTIDPVLDVPRQVVRFRLLNGSTDRTYLLGLSDNATFHLIASDGGLLSQPVSTTRVRISPGERAEIIVAFGGYNLGQQLDLVSYSSELPNGIIGADTVGTATNPIGEGYYSNPLNGLDFPVLHLNVVSPTVNPISTIPSTFASVTPFDTTGVNAHRHLSLGADTVQYGEVAKVDGPFLINDKSYMSDSINTRTLLGNKEIWTLTNATEVAHPFHIHDIQFFVLDINGMPPPPEYAGWKDVILVMPKDTVRFVGVFENFANDSVPYMYHCHLLHHEDEGMMGQFLVLNPATALPEQVNGMEDYRLFPNPASDFLTLEVGASAPISPIRFELVDATGQIVSEGVFKPQSRLDIGFLSSGYYLLRIHGRAGMKTMRFSKQ